MIIAIIFPFIAAVIFIWYTYKTIAKFLKQKSMPSVEGQLVDKRFTTGGNARYIGTYKATIDGKDYLYECRFKDTKPSKTIVFYYNKEDPNEHFVSISLFELIICLVVTIASIYLTINVWYVVTTTA